MTLQYAGKAMYDMLCPPLMALKTMFLTLYKDACPICTPYLVLLPMMLMQREVNLLIFFSLL